MSATIKATLFVVFLVAWSGFIVGQETAGPNGHGLAPAFNPAPLGSEDHPARVSGGLIAGQLLHKRNPVYPQVAKDAKAAGAIVIAILIDPEGKVKKATIVSGPQVLREPALEAVRQWTYKPFLLNGKAVFVQTTVTMNVDFGA